MTTQVVGFTPEDFPIARDAINAVRRGALEHPFHRRALAIGDAPVLIGKADGAITAGNSGTISIWTGTASASLSDSGENLTAYARMGDVTSGNWVYVALFDCGYEVIMTEC